MQRPGQFLTLIFLGILVYLSGTLAQRMCCKNSKGCNIPAGCDCPLKKELCKDVSKGILSMGKRTRSYEQNVYKQLDQDTRERHPEIRTSKIMDTILQLLHTGEQEDQHQEWKPSLRNLWKPEEFNEDLYEQEPNFYTN